MNIEIIYAFLIGLYIGRFTNLILIVIITGCLLYFYVPVFYQCSNFECIGNQLLIIFKNVIEKK